MHRNVQAFAYNTCRSNWENIIDFNTNTLLWSGGFSILLFLDAYILFLCLSGSPLFLISLQFLFIT